MILERSVVIVVVAGLPARQVVVVIVVVIVIVVIVDIVDIPETSELSLSPKGSVKFNIFC